MARRASARVPAPGCYSSHSTMSTGRSLTSRSKPAATNAAVATALSLRGFQPGVGVHGGGYAARPAGRRRTLGLGACRPIGGVFLVDSAHERPLSRAPEAFAQRSGRALHVPAGDVRGKRDWEGRRRVTDAMQSRAEPLP